MSIDLTYIDEALKCVQPGGTIWLKDGHFTDVEVKIDCSGTESKRITIMPEHPGKLTISGESSVYLSGSYIDFVHFDFKNITSPTVLFVSGTQNRVTSCTYYEENDGKTNSTNIVISNSNNRIDHNVFEGVKQVCVESPFVSVDHNCIDKTRIILNATDAIVSNNQQTKYGWTIEANSASNAIIEHNTFSGLMINGHDHAIVYKNRFTPCEYLSTHISVKHAHDTIIANNVFHESTSNALTLLGESDTYITGNAYLQCPSNLIDTSGLTTLSQFTNNMVYNACSFVNMPNLEVSSNMCFTDIDHPPCTGVMYHGTAHPRAHDVLQHHKKLSLTNVDEVGLLNKKYHIGSTNMNVSIERHINGIRTRVKNELGITCTEDTP